VLYMIGLGAVFFTLKLLTLTGCDRVIAFSRNLANSFSSRMFVSLGL
jgi:hypothetical protein